jgi:hypothetical protein
MKKFHVLSSNYSLCSKNIARLGGPLLKVTQFSVLLGCGQDVLGTKDKKILASLETKLEDDLKSCLALLGSLMCEPLVLLSFSFISRCMGNWLRTEARQVRC